MATLEALVNDPTVGCAASFLPALAALLAYARSRLVPLALRRRSLQLLALLGPKLRAITHELCGGDGLAGVGVGGSAAGVGSPFGALALPLPEGYAPSPAPEGYSELLQPDGPGGSMLVTMPIALSLRDCRTPLQVGERAWLPLARAASECLACVPFSLSLPALEHARRGPRLRPARRLAVTRRACETKELGRIAWRFGRIRRIRRD
ncbi:hypothetical protein T492DRAFT_387575 [Pavlovales sp. CCMP2436]|nr:hypothetical protein T492DRAFT_387575 [Pavlovales sp. CCMP2436]